MQANLRTALRFGHYEAPRRLEFSHSAFEFGLNRAQSSVVRPPGVWDGTDRSLISVSNLILKRRRRVCLSQQRVVQSITARQRSGRRAARKRVILGRQQFDSTDRLFVVNGLAGISSGGCSHRTSRDEPDVCCRPELRNASFPGIRIMLLLCGPESRWWQMLAKSVRRPTRVLAHSCSNPSR